MRKSVKTLVAKALSAALVCSLTVPAFADVSSAEAASKPKLSKKTVSVKVGKTAKLTVKGKKIKKTTWTVKSAKIAKLSAKKATSVTIKGVKAGSTKLTAKVKAGKKTYKLSAAIKVTKSAKKTNPPTPTQPADPTAAPTQGTDNPTENPPTETAVPTVGPTAEPTAEPLETVDPKAVFSDDFENGTGDWFGRCDPETNEVKVSISDEAYEGKGALLTTGRDRPWNSPGYDITKFLLPSASYKFSVYAKLPENSTKKSMKIRLSYAYKTSADAAEAYGNIPPDTTYTIYKDKWVKAEGEISVPAAFSNMVFYVETDGNGTIDFLLDNVQIICTSDINKFGDFDPSLTPIKDAYAGLIDIIGVATSPSELANENSFGFIKHHFNSITMGNEMKVDSMVSETTMKVTDPAAAAYVVDDAYKACADNKDADGDAIVPVINFDKMDAILKLAKENGLKVRVHSPFWHQQNPKHFFTKQFGTDASYTDKETMYAREKMYTQTLIKHIAESPYGDVVNAYDVVNEYTHMKNGDEKNYWKEIFGSEMQTDSEYVKRAFVYANEAREQFNRKDIALIYNDYNTYYETEEIIALINNINKKDAINVDGKKACDGIGMQAHLNDSGSTPEAFEGAIKAFAAQGYEIQITELDITNTGTVNSSTSDEQKAKVWEANAKMYYDIMTVILNQKKAGANITSLTIWGTTDGGSWRKDQAPVLFGASVADKKPSYDSVIKAAQDAK